MIFQRNSFPRIRRFSRSFLDSPEASFSASRSILRSEHVFCLATRRPCTLARTRRVWNASDSSLNPARRIDHHHHARITFMPSYGGNRAIPICRRVNLVGTVFFEWTDRRFFSFRSFFFFFFSFLFQEREEFLSWMVEDKNI